MTRKEAREVLRAVAGWEPVGTSVALEPVDRSNLREQIAEALAPVLGLEVEETWVIVEACRMNGGDPDPLQQRANETHAADNAEDANRGLS